MKRCQVIHSAKKVNKSGRKGTNNGLFITLVLKVSLFVGLITLGTLENLIPNVATTKCNQQKWYFVHHHWKCTSIFGHCLIPVNTQFKKTQSFSIVLKFN